MSFARYHDELKKIMANHKGRTLNSNEVKEIFVEAYPDLDVDWVSPSDHCIDHICDGACP